MTQTVRRFKLSETFLQPYKTQIVPWGACGYITFKRTYARRLSEFEPGATGTEEWWQTCRRVIEGMFYMQKQHVVGLDLEWNDAKAQRTAKEAYDRLFTLKWTPPGRGLWMMGTKFVEERTAAGLFNCAFRSTKELSNKGGYLFAWMMDALMVGIGVGFDTLGAGTCTIREPGATDEVHVIPDSREGWVESVKIVLDAFYFGTPLPEFDYSLVRPAGELIKGFGGTASGPGPLIDLHNNLIALYRPKVGQLVDSLTIVDTENYIGKCVVAGNVRRSAALAMGLATDDQYLMMKDPTELHKWEAELAKLQQEEQQHKEKMESMSDEYKAFGPFSGVDIRPAARMAQLQDLIAAHPLRDRRWGSNNSIVATVGMDYAKFAAQSQANGEPGYIWLENARHYGRMKDPERFDDLAVMGFNPCFAGSTPLLTSKGWLTFKELYDSQEAPEVLQDSRVTYSGPEIDNNNPDFWTVNLKDKSIFRSNLAKPVRLTRKDSETVTIITKQGLELTVTPDHHIATDRGLVEAQYLQSDDKILIGHTNPAVYSSKRDVNRRTGRLLGELIGDGIVYTNGLSLKVILSLWKHERTRAKSILEDIEYLWKRYGKELGYWSTLNTIRKISPYSLTKIDDRDELRISSTFLMRLFLHLGILKQTDKNNWSYPKEGSKTLFLFGLLEGLVATDGTISYTSPERGLSIRISQSNKPLLQKIQLELLSHGIYGKIYCRRSAGKTILPDGKGGQKEYPTKASYEIIFTARGRDYLASNITLYDEKLTKYETARQHFAEESAPECFWAKLESLQPGPRQDVYCLSEPKRRTVIAGGIVARRCVEQQLEDAELCCLTETYPAKHDSYEDYQRTLKIAYLYAKTVTLARTQWAETNAKMQKNRRIGLSQSGVQQARKKFGYRALMDWCNDGYEFIQSLDRTYSDWLCIPRSKRTTSIKPSGTVSLLNGSTPGIHFAEDEYYIRRIRFAEDSDMLPALKAAGYPIEKDVYSDRTMVVSFPVREADFTKGKRQASMWEQLEMAAAYQANWADNSVSVTVTFKEDEAPYIKDALEMYEGKLKAVSFLRYSENGYVQAPYEAITIEEYRRMSKTITPIQSINTSTAGKGTVFCTNDSCMVDFTQEK